MSTRLIIHQAQADMKRLWIPLKAYNAFRAQSYTAETRGIAWEFTLPEWWAWWQIDGNWSKRGNQLGQLVMARFGDRGPYSLTNVFVATVAENHTDRTAYDLAQAAAAARLNWASRTPAQRAAAPLCHTGEAHPRSRPVLTPAGRFGNATAAAASHGITRQQAANRARHELQGWSYEA